MNKAIGILSLMALVSAPQFGFSQEKATLSKLPLKAEQKSRSSYAQYITITANLSQRADGSFQLAGTIVGLNKNAFKGFVAGGLVSICDEIGHVIYRVEVPTVGVDGEYVLFGNSHRSKTFSYEIPTLVAEHANALQIENLYSPNVNTLQIYKDNLSFLKKLKKLKDAG